MARLTEVEIFSQLGESIRLAEQAARDLAVAPGAGPRYDALRNNLRLAEGCCRQVGYWRDGDARWLPLGLALNKAHQLAGEWLRGVQQPNGRRLKLAMGQRHPAFIKLADNLAMLLRLVDDLRTRKTGRIGSILPAPLPGPLRQGRPVQVPRMTPGGVFLS